MFFDLSFTVWPARRVAKWGGNWGPRAENTWKGGEVGVARGGFFAHFVHNSVHGVFRVKGMCCKCVTNSPNY